MHNITESVAFIGALNPNLRVFDVIMRTEYGTSYNSYLVKGSEKTALIEAAHNTFFESYLEDLKQALGGAAPDYLVLNHCEPDHTGCVDKLLEVFPDMTIVVSGAGAIYIKQITNRGESLKLQIAKNGDKIDLGGRTLEFIIAPFLHWPDSMFTWLPEEKMLFSCDFLGAHYCEPLLYDHKVTYPQQYLESSKYYYDCIFAPFPEYVLKGLEKIEGLDIEYACVSHGPILTKGGLLREVMDKYRRWATPQPRQEKHIPIFYVSAYGNTGLLADMIGRGIQEVLPTAKVDIHNLIDMEPSLTDCQHLMNESDAFLIGSPTLNRDSLPPIWQLLAGIEAVGFPKKPVAIFGSYGWSGEALPNIAQRLEQVKANVYPQQLKVVFVPSDDDLAAASEFGRSFARSLV